MPPRNQHHDQHHAYVTPVGRVHYGSDVFKPPVQDEPEPEPDTHVAAVDPELVEQFNEIVEKLTDSLMGGGRYERTACRADAITLLTIASDRLNNGDPVESPLAYLLREERAKALRALGISASHIDASTFLKV